MVFWIVLGLLTVIASLAVILPLAGRREEAASASVHDIEVYRDQLAEVERDAERGLIGKQEAEQARAEIGRRILKLDGADKNSSEQRRGESAFARGLAMAGVLAVPLLSWGIYNSIGSPELPGQPLAERLAKNPGESSIDELVARAEAHLRANPEDGRGWDVLAPIYARLERPAEAATAYRNAIRLLGPSAARETGLGEALMMSAGGVVPADAVNAFQRALDIDGKDPKARFYLATAMAQEGRIAEAADALRAMLADLPETSPWRGVVEQTIARAEEEASRSSTAQAGPTREDVEAASGMSAEDRSAMIEIMVAQLDERLRENPDDPEGWQRLVRSYMVLGKADEARDALTRGVAALGEDSGAARELVAFAAEQGVKGMEER